MRARVLHERVRGEGVLVGALLRMPAEEIVEMLAVAGHDFVLIDCEHGPDDAIELRRHIAAARLHDLEVIVRIGLDQHDLALRALDAGASGILAPHIDTPEQARALVDACHYPPLGHRGFATYSRAGGFGTAEPRGYQARGADTLVFAMPESPAAALGAGEVFAVEGLDGYMIGVADLAASTLDRDPTPAESCALIHAAGRDHGLARLDIVGSVDAARAAVADGARVIVYNLTAVLMTTFGGLGDVRTPPDAAAT